MKISTLFSVLVLGVAAFAGSGHAAVVPELTGAQVLQKCAAAYDALPSYVGTTSVVSASVMRVGTGDAAHNETRISTGTARIEFSRPGKLRVVGVDMLGKNYSLVCAGQNAWFSSVSMQGDADFKKQDSTVKAVAMATGASALSAATVSSLLLDLPFKTRFVEYKAAQLQGHETLDCADCYKVVANGATGTDTFWIDSQSFLLRRKLNTATEAQIAATLASFDPQKMAAIKAGTLATLRNLPGGEEVAKELSGNTPPIQEFCALASSTDERFGIESTTAKLDDVLFQDPTRTAETN